MAQSNLVVKNRYSNYYEAQYHRLRDTSKVFNDVQQFDDNWKKVKDGQSQTFQNLDTYINSLDVAANKNLDYDTVSKNGLRTDDRFLLSLFTETLADNKQAQERQRYVLNDDGTPVINANGTREIESYNMTDRDYLRQLLNEEDNELLKQQKYEQIEKEKAAVSGWEKFGRGVLNTLARFTSGMANAASGFLSFCGSSTEYVKTLFETGSFDKAAEAKVKFIVDYDKYISFAKDFSDDVEYMETYLTGFRTADGQETTVGKYLGGVSYTIGQMMPGMVAGNAIGLAGGAISGAAGVGTAAYNVGKGVSMAGKAASSLIFYSAMANDSIKESYVYHAKNGIPVNYQAIVANAELKAWAQFGVEVGLAKVLGASGLDKLVFGRTGQGIIGSGSKALAKTAGSGKLATIGKGIGKLILYYGKDFVKEGTEEVFQDMSDALINVIFDSAFNTKFYEQNPITRQSLADSFVLGGLASLVGSTTSLILQKRRSTGKVKLDKDGKPIIDTKETEKQRSEAHRELDNNIKLFTDLMNSEMERLSVTNVDELVLNPESMFTPEHLAYINGESELRAAIDEEVVYEEEMLGKLDSMDFDGNMQSVIENFTKLKEQFERLSKNKDNLSDRQVRNYAKTFADIYLVSRVIMEFYNEIGDERFKKANDILTYVRENVYQDTLGNTVLEAKKIVDSIDKARLESVKKSAKKALTPEERVSALSEDTEEAPAPVTPRAQEALDTLLRQQSIRQVNLVDRQGAAELDENGNLSINPFSLDSDLSITFSEIGVGKLVNEVYDMLTEGKFRLSDSEYATFESIYKTLYPNSKVDRKAVLRTFCLDPIFIREVLHNNLTKFVFQTILRVQSSIKNMVVPDELSADIKTKYQQLSDQMKNVLTDFIIKDARINDFADYGLFTKQEYEDIVNAQYESRLMERLLTRTLTNDDWTHIENLLKYTNYYRGAFTTYPTFESLKKHILSGDLLAVTDLRNILYKSSPFYNDDEFFPDTKEENRLFNDYLRSKGLNKNNWADDATLTDDEIAQMEAMDDDFITDAVEYRIAEFQKRYKDIRILYYSGNTIIMKTVSQSHYDRDIVDWYDTKNSTKMAHNKNTKYAIPSFDRSFELKFLKDLIGNKVTDARLTFLTIQDVIDDPSILRNEYIEDILDVYGDVNEDTVFSLINAKLNELTNHKFRLGKTNTGKALVYTSYNFEDVLLHTVNETRDILNSAIDYDVDGDVYIYAKDVFKPEWLVGKGKDTKIKVVSYDSLTDCGGYYNARSNTIVIGTYFDPVTFKIDEIHRTYSFNTLLHEFQHLIQDVYKMEEGFSTSILFAKDKNGNTVINDHVIPLSERAKIYRCLDVIDELYPDLKSEDKSSHMELLSELIYLNCGELFARGIGFHGKFAYTTPVSIYTDDHGKYHIKIFGVDIATDITEYYSLSSPFYSNVYDVLGIETPSLDPKLITLTSKVRLSSIDVSKITPKDTEDSVQRLYQALGGDKQFKSLKDFYNMKLPILFFQGSTEQNTEYVIATIGNIDKTTVEKLMKGKEGILYTSYITPADITYFEPNGIKNTIVKKSSVFADTEVAIAKRVDGNMTLTYGDQVITASTNNVIVPAGMSSPRVFDKRKDHESKILMADHASRIKQLEEKYSKQLRRPVKVIRAEYIEHPDKKSDRNIRYYFDQPITENVDYVNDNYTKPEGSYRGVRVTGRKAKRSGSPSMAKFKGKNRSPEFQAFIKVADKYGLDKLPDQLSKKIKDGTLTMWDIDAYIRETRIEELDEEVFKMLNETIYKNPYIKTLKDLQDLVDGTATIYAAGVVLYVLRQQDKLDAKVNMNVVEYVMKVLGEEDPSLARRFNKQKEKFESYSTMEYDMLKLFYLKHYEGTLSSAFHTANFIKIAKEDHWNITGVLQTESTDEERTNSEGEQYLEQIEDTTNADTMAWLMSHDITEKIRETLRATIALAKKTELKGKMMRGELTLSYGQALMAFAGIDEESISWSDEDLKKLYAELKVNREELNRLYAAVMAADVTGDPESITKPEQSNDISVAVDVVQRKPENVVRNIRNYLKTIKRNLSEAEVKTFIKQNRDLFNDDLTIKDEVLYNLAEDEKLVLKDLSILLEIEDRFRQLSKLAQMHILSDRKAKSIKNRTDAYIANLEREIERLKRTRVAPSITVRQVQQYVVNDIAIDVNTSVPMPDVFRAFLTTEFDKVSKSQIKLTQSEDPRHVRAEIDKFYEQNAELLRGMSNTTVQELANFFLSSDALATTNKFSVYISAQVAVMIYILNDAHNQNLFGLSKETIAALDKKLDDMKTMFAQGMAVIREVEKKMYPGEATRVVLKALAKKMSLTITEDDMKLLADAVATGDYKKMAQAQAQIYNNMKEEYKDVKINFFEKLLKFSRVAMLSNPGTWIRNWTSNLLVTGLNRASEYTGDALTKLLDKVLLAKHELHRQRAEDILKQFGGKVENMTPEARRNYEKEYEAARKTNWLTDDKIYKRLHLVKVSDDTSKFIQSEVFTSGLWDLISDGLNKYDDIINKKSDVSNDVVKLIADSIRTQVFNSNITDSKALQGFYNFVYKMLSDEGSIKKAFVRYLGKTLTYDKVDLTKGITKDVMQHIVDAYTLAAYDYMHKPNFVTQIEGKMREKFGSAGFYVYKSVFPFLGASMNWFMEGLNYTPIGLAISIFKYVNLEKTISKMYDENKQGRGVSYRFAQYLTSRNIGKGLIGTVGFAIGAALAAAGVAGIDDEDDKVKLHIGDLYIDISDIFGSAGILQGMALVSAIKDKKNGADTFMGVLKFTFDQMFADSTISSLWNTIRQSNGMSDILMNIPFNMIDNLIPNIISVVSVTNKYKNKFESGIVGRLEKTLLKALPSLSYALPKYVDPYTGEYQVQYKIWWLTKLANKLGPIDFYPYNVSDTEKTAIGLGVRKGNLTCNWSVNGEDVKYTGKKRQALNELYGKLNKKSLKSFTNNSNKYKVQDTKSGKYYELYYSQMTDAQKATVMNRIMESNEKIVKIYALTSSGKYRYYATKEEYQALTRLGITKNIYTKTNKLEGFQKIT